MQLKILSTKRRAALRIAVILAAMVTVPREASALAREELVVSVSVGCHSSASDASITIRELGVGERITVAERLDGWIRVAGNPSCWIADAALEETAPVARERSTVRARTLRAAPAPLTFRAPRKSTRQARQALQSGSCPCGSGNVCVGPRGGRYCITSGGNKRYGL